jgi:hypothetical protein
MLSGPRSDAGVYARHLIRQHFQDPRLSGQLDTFYSVAGIIISFVVACQKEARDEWIRQLGKIMKDAGLPWHVRKDTDGASPFILFLWELQKCLPKACKLPYAKSALPTAVARARRNALRVNSPIRSAKSGHKNPLSTSE